MALALDEPQDSDKVLDVSGYTFLIDQELYDKAAPFHVDMTGFGFSVESRMELGGGGCGSSCSGGSCSTS